jgi:P-type Ca2+ transporter type 2C
MDENIGRSLDKWHTYTADEVIDKLDTDDKQGLSNDEAADRLKKFGENALEDEKRIAPFQLFVSQLKNPLIYLLIAAAAATIIAQHFIDAGAIIAVIILNTILGFVQEWRAEQALEALKKMTSPTAKVIRNGERIKIDAHEIVPGDIIAIETGDRIPADARVTEAEELEIDESALTGESEPVVKNTDPVENDASIGDRHNMVWMSTSITSGRGKAVVVGTGMNTEMGQIAGEVRGTQREETPLQKKIGSLGKTIAVVAVIVAFLVFIVGLFQGYDIIEILLFSIAAAVSAIPAGLPAVISVTLALGVQRMAEKNSIIRRLPAVETLGSTTVVCSDKTGTITKNEMTITRLYTGGRMYRVTGEGYRPEGKIEEVESGKEIFPGSESENENESKIIDEEFKILLEIGILANNAQLVQSDEVWKIDGNPTEGAIVVASAKAGLDTYKMQNEMERQNEIPFSSDDKYMAVSYKSNGKTIAYIKGAPERMIEFSSKIMENGKIVDLDDTKRKELEKINDELAGQALRVVGGAYKQLDGEELSRENAEKDLIFIGFWGMIDPPREEAIEAIQKAKKAGMRVVMLTGDHSKTATAIAKKTGITKGDREALTGKDIEEASKEQLTDYALNVGVFARVSPSHKLKILEALKESNEIVAMTGDGVNDAPALKGANIGVAMGETGTEVAREAADMVLADDNFATIINAVEEGRVIYNNLKRVIFYLLTTNLGEILVVSSSVIIGLELPLTAVMILWINLITDGACTIPLGVEPMHGDVLTQPPRDPDAPVLDKFIIRRILSLAPIMAIGTLLMFYYNLNNNNFLYARTMAFTTLAAFQWFQAFNARTTTQSLFTRGIFTNRWILVGVGAAIILQLGAVYTPQGQLIFETVSLSALDWLAVIMVSSLIFIIDEMLTKLKAYGTPFTHRIKS